MTADQLQYTSLTYVSNGRTKVRWFLTPAEAYRWLNEALWPAEAATATIA